MTFRSCNWFTSLDKFCYELWLYMLSSSMRSYERSLTEVLSCMLSLYKWLSSDSKDYANVRAALVDGDLLLKVVLRWLNVVMFQPSMLLVLIRFRFGATLLIQVKTKFFFNKFVSSVVDKNFIRFVLAIFICLSVTV